VSKEVIAMQVKERIEQQMEKRHWSIYRLGKESGLSQSTLAHVFRKESEPTISTLATICKAFGITLSQFFADDDFVAISGEQREILDKWSALSDEQKKLVSDIIANMK